MVALGLVLLLVGLGGGALLTWMALQTPDTVALGAPGLQLNVAPVTVFAAGAVAMLLLWLGARLMAAGTRRRVAQRRELRELKNAPQPTRPPAEGAQGRPHTASGVTPDRGRDALPPTDHDPHRR